MLNLENHDVGDGNVRYNSTNHTRREQNMVGVVYLARYEPEKKPQT